MFGKYAANETTNNISVLDVRNVTALQFSDHFPLREDSANANSDNTPYLQEQLQVSSWALPPWYV